MYRDLERFEVAPADRPEVGRPDARVRARDVATLDGERQLASRLQRKHVRQSGGPDTRYCPDLLLDLFLEPCQGLAPAISGLGQREPHRQHAVHLEPKRRGLQADEALDQQERTDGEHQREGDFAGDERLPSPASALSRDPNRSCAKDIADTRACRVSKLETRRMRRLR